MQRLHSTYHDLVIIGSIEPMIVLRPRKVHSRGRGTIAIRYPNYKPVVALVNYLNYPVDHHQSDPVICIQISCYTDSHCSCVISGNRASL